MEKKDRTELAGTGYSGRRSGPFLKGSKTNYTKIVDKNYFLSELLSCTLKIRLKLSFGQDPYLRISFLHDF